MNIEIAKQRRMSLFGMTHASNARIDPDTMAIGFKLAMRGIKVTEDAILAERMRINLEEIPETNQYKPFLQAVLVMFRDRIKNI